MSISSALSLLADVGITEADLNKAVAESAEVRGEVIKTATEARDYWKSIAPVGTREHTLKDGYVDKPGDYKESIRVRFKEGKNGLEAKVYSNDYKAAFLEYGTGGDSPTPEFACRQRTVDHFNGSGNTVEAG